MAAPDRGHSRFTERRLYRALSTLPPDDDPSPHVGVYLTVVGLLPHAPEGVRKPLSLPQASGVKRSWFVRRRGGVRGGVLVDPDDPRPPLDGDLGRREAEVLDQDLLRRMLLLLARLARSMLVCPGGHNND